MSQLDLARWQFAATSHLPFLLVPYVFGAPLAMEGLAAFFLESTFWAWFVRLGPAVAAGASADDRR